MKTIKQIEFFKASPHELYEAILNPKIHSEFTGGKATNSMKVGGKFTSYDDYASGTNLKLEKDKKIVQKWTTTDLDGIYTEITFDFKKTKEGTKLIFTQKNVPDDRVHDIGDGWNDFYWKPLKEFLEQ